MSTDTLTAYAGPRLPGLVSIENTTTAQTTESLATIPWAEADRLANKLREAARRARIYKAGLDPDKRYRKLRGHVVWRVHDMTPSGAYLLRVDGDQATYQAPDNLEEVDA